MVTSTRLRLLGAACAFAIASSGAVAAACGCFAPPDPTVPVLQAGERIAFARAGNQVIAHIQIQYQGTASEFGWLLPLPSVPTLELGTDELFSALAGRTGPVYYTVVDKYCGPPPPMPGGSLDLGVTADLGGGGPSPVVVQDSIGPYDYAVLKADSKDEMLTWLKNNRYFVPAGTDGAVGPYIHPGGYFLALKLRSGQSSGDIQPVVLRYESDLPMIPIILTSVTSQPRMPVWVWMLGDSRAIPRNYYHVVLDEARIDWQSNSGYDALVSEAVAAAPGKHAFVTEYAGTSSIMRDVLDDSARFGDLAALRALTDPLDYLRFLRNNRFPYSSTLLALLARSIPEPLDLVAAGIKPAQFYFNADFYKQTRPAAFAGWKPAYDPVALTHDIDERVVKPTRAAGGLFRSWSYLTRLHTRISPEDMTRDPAFSYNPFLPDVDRVHVAHATMTCDAQGTLLRTRTVTPSGYVLDRKPGQPLPSLPAAERVEILRESGSPEVVTDNHLDILAALGQTPDGGSPGDGGAPGPTDHGCSIGGWSGAAGGAVTALGALGLVLAFAAFAVRRRGR